MRMKRYVEKAFMLRYPPGEGQRVVAKTSVEDVPAVGTFRVLKDVLKSLENITPCLSSWVSFLAFRKTEICLTSEVDQIISRTSAIQLRLRYSENR